MTSSNAECGALFPQLVARLFAQLLERLPRFLDTFGYTDVRTTHILNVFLHLDKDGERPATLARRAGITPQSMGELITYLEKRGYVARIPDPADGRGKIVVYAPRGVEAATRLTEWFNELDRSWSGSMPEAEGVRDGLIQLSAKLESENG